jgi:chromosome segregation ATPase
MSTAAAVQESELPLAADDFSALEQRVLRTVELLKTEREARAAAEQRIAALESKVQQLSEQTSNAAAEIETLEHEREVVRTRVERLLKHLDEITG